MSTEPVLTQHTVTVLLIDDQPMFGEAVRRMLAGEPDISFHYSRDANTAIEEAGRFKPTVILQDLVMPEIDGLALVRKFRANEPTRERPLIVLSTKEEPTVKAEAFALGANDYIVKLPDRLELLARIRYHSTLDVSGHGVGSALLSVSAMNALRSQALPQTDFRAPGQVLSALNNAFQMDQQKGLFFTIWYGVYHKPARRLNYSGGGHPPVLLLSGPSSDQAVLEILEATGPMIGAVPDLEFKTASTALGAFSKLYLYSDGVYEIDRTDKIMWPFNEFLDFMKQGPHDVIGDSKIDRLIAYGREIQGREEFVDDCSIVELQFV